MERSIPRGPVSFFELGTVIMASSCGRWFRVCLAGAVSLLGLAGCGEAFTATGGGTTGGGGASTGGSTSMGGATGGSGGVTGGSGGAAPECTGNQTKPCFSGEDINRNVGECKDGTKKCVDGMWSKTCDNEVLPATEICGDQLDSDCDGSKDNTCPCTGNDTQDCYGGPMGTAGVGVCKVGTQTCMNAAWGPCMGAVTPQDETCANVGVDDNCDGNMNDVAQVGDPCNTMLPGVCQSGTYQCKATELKCIQNVQPGDETCDGLDHNCNGVPNDVMGQCNIQLPGNVTCSGVLKCNGNTVACGSSIYLIDNFSGGNANWTLQGEWAIGATAVGGDPPDIGNSDPANDHTGSSVDNKVAGIVLGGNINTEVHGPDWLTSKAINTNKPGTVFLSFYRWLNSAGLPDMVDMVEVATTGGNWTPLPMLDVGPIQDGVWTLQVFDVSAFKSNTFQVRFGVKVLNPVPAVSSWNIDDVVVGSCPPN